MSKRLISVLVALIMVIGLMPAVGATGADISSQFSDMPNNWATEALEFAVANHLLQGADGKIMPDKPLTRAEMATIIVRAFGASEEGDISSYTDVRKSDWFFEYIAKAFKMGVMEGYSGKMNPDSNITREQAFTVLARALKLQPATRISKTFSDIEEISDWARGSIYALVNAGYIQGSNGKLNPKADITRAEFAQVMFNLIKQYISEEGEYTEVAEGNVMINVPGATLKGLTVSGDLIIGDGVGDGDVVLDDVVVTGRLVIRGGGENSIIIRGNSNVSYIVAARVDGTVRILVEDDAEVEVIYVDDGSDDIIVEGNVGQIEIVADNVTVLATGASIGSANITGVNSRITVDADSEVESISVRAANASIDVEGSVNEISTSGANTNVTGGGKVDKVNVEQGGNGASITTPNTEISVGENVTGVTAGGGEEVEGGQTVKNNKDGTGIVSEPPASGGTYVPPVIPVSAISVEGVAKVGETLTAKVTPEKATVTYKWMRADAEDGEYVAIAGATDKTYTLSEADAGKWIKVEVKGTGNYTGTKSKVVGPVEEVEEPIETIEAIIDYNAVWNESRGTWYIKVTVPNENLDAGSVKSIHAITEAGVDLDEPRELTPDTDTVMWFGVAKADGEVTLKRDGKYAYKVVRQDDSEYIFSFDYAANKVQGEINLVQAALQAVNDAGTTAAMQAAIEDNAAVLGLDMESYNELKEARQPSVSVDLLSNKPEDGYDLATLQEYFNAIVATRHATQASMDKVNNAKSIADLDGISWVTDLLAQFEAADEVYDYHSGIALSEKIATLQGLVDRYNSLDEAGKAAVLQKLLDKRPEDGYARSQATTDALAEALTGAPPVYNEALKTYYMTLQEAIAAARSGDTINIFGDCSIVGAAAGNKNLTFVGTSSKPKIEFPQGKDTPNYQTYYGCVFTFEDLTLQCEPDKNYQGIQPDKAIVKNCVINGKFWGYAKDLEFTDCIFNQNSSYNIWTYGSNVTFNNCEFNSAGRSVLVYNEGATLQTPAKVVFKVCTFSASQPVDMKAAIDVDTRFASFIVEIENCSASGFSDTTEPGGTVIVPGLIHLKASDKGTLTVKVDGVQVYPIEPTTSFSMGTEILEEEKPTEVETPTEEETPDIAPLEAAIQEAIAAKEGVVVSEDGSDVPAGTYWVTQEAMDALDAAIAAAEAAKETVKTQQDVDEAVEELEAAVTAFNEAKQVVTAGEEELEETEDPVNEQEPGNDEEPLNTEQDTGNDLEGLMETVNEEDAA